MVYVSVMYRDNSPENISDVNQQLTYKDNQVLLKKLIYAEFAPNSFQNLEITTRFSYIMLNVHFK